MAHSIKTKSFTIKTETEKEALTILLKLTGRNIASLSSYMGVSEEDIILVDDDGVETVALWAINYLKDLADVELVHLGYVIKDLKALGLFVDYDEIAYSVTKAIAEETVIGSQPITINKDIIVTEAGSIKAKYLVNAQSILQDFLQQS